jgi:hypothetical protein
MYPVFTAHQYLVSKHDSPELDFFRFWPVSSWQIDVGKSDFLAQEL